MRFRRPRWAATSPSSSRAAVPGRTRCTSWTPWRRLTTSTAGTATPRRSTGSTGRVCRLSCRLAACPVSGDWYRPAVGNGQIYTYKWETFVTQELPAWLSTNKNVASDGDAVVGASMGGSSALDLAAHHPQQFIYAGSMSGFLNLSQRPWPALVHIAMQHDGGFDSMRCGGPPPIRPGRATTPRSTSPHSRVTTRAYGFTAVTEARHLSTPTPPTRAGWVHWRDSRSTATALSKTPIWPPAVTTACSTSRMAPTIAPTGLSTCSR